MGVCSLFPSLVRKAIAQLAIVPHVVEADLAAAIVVVSVVATATAEATAAATKKFYLLSAHKEKIQALPGSFLYPLQGILKTL
jgi:hypothetical protein